MAMEKMTKLSRAELKAMRAETARGTYMQHARNVEVTLASLRRNVDACKPQAIKSVKHVIYSLLLLDPDRDPDRITKYQKAFQRQMFRFEKYCTCKGKK